MLVELLVDTIKGCEECAHLEALARDHEKQQKIEKTFLEECKKFDGLISQIYMLSKSTDFQPSNSVINELRNIITLIQKAYDEKKSSDQINGTMSSNRQKLQLMIQEEWKHYYSNKSEQLISMLKTIIEITPDKQATQQVINCIVKGYEWKTDSRNIELFKSGIKNGEEIINGLDLNDKILTFIKRVSEGTVTLGHLDDEIVGWIKKENLTHKFRVSFSMFNNR